MSTGEEDSVEGVAIRDLAELQGGVDCLHGGGVRGLFRGILRLARRI